MGELSTWALNVIRRVLGGSRQGGLWGIVVASEMEAKVGMIQTSVEKSGRL